MKQKLLIILLPILLGLLGYGLGSTVTKLSIEKSKTKETSTITAQPPNPSESESEQKEAGYETYTVMPGDTLFGISLKFKVSMDELAQLNGISDANQIKAGQVLKIPKEGGIAESGKIEIDLAKMREIQALVDQGEQSWRLDPVEVTKATAPASFEFNALDSYTLKSKDLGKGEAVVIVKKTKDSQTQNFQVDLIQPVTKGEKGIWAIVSIKETS